MKEKVKDKFEKLKNKYPNLTSIMLFVKMVTGKRISDVQLRKEFDSLVDKEDWSGTPKEQIINWLKRDIIKK